MSAERHKKKNLRNVDGRNKKHYTTTHICVYGKTTCENVGDEQHIADAALIPVLTKAIQELSAKNDALEARILALES